MEPFDLILLIVTGDLMQQAITRSVVLMWEEWEAMVEKLRDKGVPFTIGPLVRFEGRNGEQARIYSSDPCGNVVEFKAFRDPETRFLPFDENA